jgi:hypothetical protein
MLSVASLQAPALAGVEGHAALMGFPGGTPLSPGANLGLEAELGPAAQPWSLGAAGWIELYHSPALGWEHGAMALSAWGRLRLFSWEDQTVSVLAGGNYQPPYGYGCIDTCASPTPYGLLLGVSWIYQAERLWLRVSPHYVAPVGGTRSESGLGLSTIAWAEFGIRLTPQLDLAVRLSNVPVEVIWNF